MVWLQESARNYKLEDSSEPSVQFGGLGEWVISLPCSHDTRGGTRETSTGRRESLTPSNAQSPTLMIAFRCARIKIPLSQKPSVPISAVSWYMQPVYARSTKLAPAVRAGTAAASACVRLGCVGTALPLHVNKSEGMKERGGSSSGLRVSSGAGETHQLPWGNTAGISFVWGASQLERGRREDEARSAALGCRSF